MFATFLGTENVHENYYKSYVSIQIHEINDKSTYIPTYVNKNIGSTFVWKNSEVIKLVNYINFRFMAEKVRRHLQIRQILKIDLIP